MAKTPIVRKYMKKPSRTFREDEEMAPCMSILARSSFAAIPVVNEDDEVVGLLTEKDVIRTVINWAYDQRAGGKVPAARLAERVGTALERDLQRRWLAANEIKRRKGHPLVERDLEA